MFERKQQALIEAKEMLNVGNSCTGGNSVHRVGGRDS
jgi:hypothetical protein